MKLTYLFAVSMAVGFACTLAACSRCDPTDNLQNSEALVSAAADGKLADVKRLLRQCANPNSTRAGSDGGPPHKALNTAITHGHQEIVARLIEAGASVDDTAMALATGNLLLPSFVPTPPATAEIIKMVMHHGRRTHGEEIALTGELSVVVAMGGIGAFQYVVQLQVGTQSRTLRLSSDETEFVDFPRSISGDGSVLVRTGGTYRVAGVAIGEEIEVEKITLLSAPDAAQNMELPLSRYLPLTRRSFEANFSGPRPR